MEGRAGAGAGLRDRVPKGEAKSKEERKKEEGRRKKEEGRRGGVKGGLFD
jgi:ribosomal protein L12E/L44/L45/RPP1/RPP2